MKMKKIANNIHWLNLFATIFGLWFSIIIDSEFFKIANAFLAGVNFLNWLEGVTWGKMRRQIIDMQHEIITNQQELIDSMLGALKKSEKIIRRLKDEEN